MAEKKATSSKGKAPAEGKAPKKTAAVATGEGATPGEACKAEGCKQPVRAKGYCRKHFLAWRRGDLGKKHRYKICSKEGCRKPALAGGRCAEHKKGGGATEAPAAAG